MIYWHNDLSTIREILSPNQYYWHDTSLLNVIVLLAQPHITISDLHAECINDLQALHQGYDTHDVIGTTPHLNTKALLARHLTLILRLYWHDLQYQFNIHINTHKNLIYQHKENEKHKLPSRAVFYKRR